jgi:hypothetical protein
MPAAKLALIPALLLAACSDELVDAPPINTQIASEPGTPATLEKVQCDGPDQELALLGSLCGAPTLDLGWSMTSAPGAGMATSVGEDGAPLLIIFNEVKRSPGSQDNVAGEVSHAAYIVLDSVREPESSVARLNQWSDGEAVESGAVVVENVQFDACSSSSWRASAGFRWRSSEIALSWTSGRGC